jgi:hypothetical protein
MSMRETGNMGGISHSLADASAIRHDGFVSVVLETKMAITADNGNLTADIDEMSLSVRST